MAIECVYDLADPGGLTEPTGETPVVDSGGFGHFKLPSAQEVKRILNLFIVVRRRDRWEMPDRIAAMRFQPQT